MSSRTHMKSGNLAVSSVSKNISRRCHLTFKHADRIRHDARKKHVCAVPAEIFSDRSDNIGLHAEKREVVGDVPCRASKTHGKPLDLEAKINGVELIRHQMFRKHTVEIHDAVVRY